MPTRKPPFPPTTAHPADLHSAVPDFIRRGQQAQAGVDEINAAENERLRAKRPKGRA